MKTNEYYDSIEYCIYIFRRRKNKDLLDPELMSF